MGTSVRKVVDAESRDVGDHARYQAADVVASEYRGAAQGSQFECGTR